MVAAVALVLAGCGSNVKLDPPIAGRAAPPVQRDRAAGAAGQGAGQSTVARRCRPVRPAPTRPGPPASGA
jgi:hypothetical protein